MKKKIYLATVSILMLFLSACGNKNENKSISSENSSKDDMVIVSHEIKEEADSEYYQVLFTVKNQTDEKITYQYIGLRTIGENNVVKGDFDSWNQMSMETELEPDQAAIQENMFAYSDNLQTIEVDTYCYLDENGDYVEKDLAEKYIVDVTEIN